jgi:hypothetical protein
MSAAPQLLYPCFKEVALDGGAWSGPRAASMPAGVEGPIEDGRRTECGTEPGVNVGTV